MRKEVFPAGCCRKKGFRSGIITLYPILMVFFIISAGWTQTLPLKAHIPWDWINDFEFYENGIFIASENENINYYTVDEDFNLTYRYTIDPGGLHKLSQFCVEESYLYALDGASMHQCGTPILFDYEVNETGYEYLGGIEPSGTIWAQFDPIIYHNGSIIYQDYPGDYYRIDVSNPANPILTGCILGTNDVCHDMIVYQDTLLITSMQRGAGFWDGNFRIMRNIPPDPLTSVGTYGFNSYSYTAAVLNIDNILFTSHNNGLRVYDLSDLGNVQQIYFYPSEWSRCLARSNEFIFMGCNNGWHVFEYTSPGDIQHLEFYPNDTRVLRMRMKPEEEELWCFVDGGSLGGLVVLDVSTFTGIEESETGPVSGLPSIQSFPNPFSTETTISYSIPVDGHTTLRVYNLKGQLVRTLADDYMQSPQSGCHSVLWDGRDDGNGSLPNSVYICHLVSGNSTATCRLMLVK